MSITAQVLSEFIEAWNTGQRPNVREYLRRVPEGEDRDALADEIGMWLEIAPPPPYTEAQRVAIREEPLVQRVFAAVDSNAGLWPAVVPPLRVRARLSVRELAARVVSRFGLGAGDEERAADYLQRLEDGQLEPSRVSRRMLDALGELLGVEGGLLLGSGSVGGGATRPAAAGGTMFRAYGESREWIADDMAVLADAAMAPAPAAFDELDRLFVGGPEA